jgi:hypothetical protein
MCAEDIQAEFRTQTPRNLIGRNMIPRRVIDQQYASATFVTLRFHFLKEKFGVLFFFKKRHFNFIFGFLRWSKSETELTLNSVILGMSVKVKLSSCR